MFIIRELSHFTTTEQHYVNLRGAFVCRLRSVDPIASTTQAGCPLGDPGPLAVLTRSRRIV
jgi:hypothetical protein